MSTLKRPPHLLKISMSLVLGLSGCASTPGQQRTGPLSKMKTYLAVGDKPLPVVSGEPGSTISGSEPSDVDPPSPRRSGKGDGRISGRVYDAAGRPVPDARVRLAVNGASGGKVVKTSTDRSGAFTLHGLRANSDYTVIAEWEGDDGPMSGRAVASTDESDVRIKLVSQDEPKAIRATVPAKVRPVSEVEASPDDPEPENLPRAIERRKPMAFSRELDDSQSVAVNEEDLPPPLEAENLPRDSRVDQPAPMRRPPPTAAIGARTWRSGVGTTNAKTQPVAPGDSATSAESQQPEPINAPIDPETRGTSATAISNPADTDDDGPNPLPPALERAEDPEPAPIAKPRPKSAPDTTRTMQGFPRIAGETTRPSSPSREKQAEELPSSAPGSLVVAQETFGPIVFQNDPFASDTPPEIVRRGPASVAPEAPSAPTGVVKPRASRRPEAIARRDPPPAASIRQDPFRDEAPVKIKPAPAPRETRKPKWGDVAASAKDIPPLERDSLAANRPHDAKADPGITRRSFGTKSGTKGEAVQASLRSDLVKFAEPYCDYDDRHRRIVDFRLPDLDGKPVRFQDIDADLILLDFWGTWCQPCLRSVPHLIELQERLGSKIAVVGIACEPDPRDEAVARVKATARKLKVNYPILVSKNDGTCPIQEALHIQAFPTLVLVDRQGRVIWRDQGATPATLARLDRALALSPDAKITR